MNRPVAASELPFRRTGSVFYWSSLVGLLTFGAYILLRATGATIKNFGQWNDLVSGASLGTADWIASVGIGMHYFMGAVLVIAWPILFSTRIRVRHRAFHRWTGRVYVTAGLLAGVGGMSFIFAHHTGTPAHTAFAIWGGVMTVSSVLAYVHARARRFDLHRAWAIRLFAMVLGSWIFDLEYRAWSDLTGSAGINDPDNGNLGAFDYAILYLFFVPNLLVAEFFIRNKHRNMGSAGVLKWPALAALAASGAIFVYAIVVSTATASGKYGYHLVRLVGEWWK